jgi:hypothetical protein
VTDPPLVPVLGDSPTHTTACLHPLEVGEDLALARPAIADSEIHLAEETGSAQSPTERS